MTEHERLGPPPVEPLSDVTWARVERGLWARLDSPTLAEVTPAGRSWRWLWIATPMLGAAAALAVVVGTRDTGKPIPAVAEGAEPSRVVAGAAPSSISFGDAHIELDAHSAIAMRRDAGKPITQLENGAAWFTVAPRAERPPFEVLAGDTIVRVVGTRFRVARAEERVSVEVEHGIVDVQFRGTLVKVGADQAWSSEHPNQVTSRTHRDSAATPATTTTTATTKPDVTATADTTPSIDPKSTRKTTVHQSPTVKTDKAAPPTANVDTTKLDPATESKKIDPDRVKFERLTALEARDPKAALAGYLELSQGSGRWAEVSLFAAGRLAADRHDARAETMLTIYLRRFPSGANVDDARELLARLKGETR